MRLSLVPTTSSPPSDKSVFKENAGRFDFILDTVSAAHDYNAYLNLLCIATGPWCWLASRIPNRSAPSPWYPSGVGLQGRLIGGIRETQEMLDFCAAHGLAANVEVIPIQQINEAYERMIKNDVRYRFVIDMAGLKGGAALDRGGGLPA